jgi:hypothetical protein
VALSQDYIRELEEEKERLRAQIDASKSEMREATFPVHPRSVASAR